MEKIILIIGKHNSGKSTIAKALVSGLKEEEKCFLTDYKVSDQWAFSCCTELTKVIIIDDLRVNEPLDGLIFSAIDGIKVNRKMKDPFIIKPKIIVVLREEITKKQILQFGASTLRRIEIIETFK